MNASLRLIVLTAAAITIIGTGAIYYFAILNKPIHTVTVQISGNGRVLLGATGAYSTILQVNDGDSLLLTASPDPGWTFSQWTGDISGNTNPNNIVVTKDLKITAIFTK
jgi:uncharacterized repeat protein (TIGR02543 family)